MTRIILQVCIVLLPFCCCFINSSEQSTVNFSGECTKQKQNVIKKIHNCKMITVIFHWNDDYRKKNWNYYDNNSCFIGKIIIRKCWNHRTCLGLWCVSNWQMKWWQSIIFQLTKLLIMHKLWSIIKLWRMKKYYLFVYFTLL